MRHATLAAFTSSLIFLGASAMAGGYDRVTSKADFLAVYGGKKATMSGGWFVINADGSTEGRVQGRKISGSWAWQNNMFCRTLAFSGGKPDTDCLVITQKGTKGKWIRQSGKGKSLNVSIK